MSSQLLASAYDVLSGPANGLLGRTGDDDGASNLPSPTALGNLSTWYDVSDVSSLELDASNRCQLIADKSGNSGENCLVLPGVNGNYASTSKYVPPAGVVMRVEVCIDADLYTPALNGYFNAVWDGTNDRAWATGITVTTGTARVLMTSSGASGTTQTIVSTEAIPDGTRYVAYVVDSTGGTVDFEISSDGISWSALGAQVAITAITIYQSSAAGLEMGSLNSGGTASYQGKIYSSKIYADGVLVRNFDATAQAKLATSWAAATTGETWTINSTAIALPARIHGARDLYMGTAASQPYYAAWSGTNYGYLNGVSGNYFSTPDSAALSPTTEFEVIAELTRLPGEIQYVISQDDGGANRAYYLYMNTSGTLVVRTVDTSSAVVFLSSSANLPVGKNFIKVTVEQDNGANCEVTYYTGSSRTGPWSLLGVAQTASSKLSIVNKSNDVWVGRQGSNYSQGKISYVGFSTTIGGAPTAVWDASDYPSTGGSTFVSSATGETWTINGGAKIVTRTGLYFDGSNDYMKTAAFALSQPENVYFVGEQVTWTSGDTLLDGRTTSTLRLYQTNASPDLLNNAGGLAGTNYISPTLQTGQVLMSGFNTTSSELRKARDTAVVNSVGNGIANGSTIGCTGNAGGNFANIFVSEILIYDTTAHDTATQDRIALYEGQKWGILV